jgi:hypothetical protein
LDGLDWAPITREDEIHIIVPDTVNREIDKLKRRRKIETWRAALTEGAKEAKFLFSLFARFRTTTTRSLRLPAARIRRDTFAYPDGAEPINNTVTFEVKVAK